MLGWIMNERSVDGEIGDGSGVDTAMESLDLS